MDENLSKPNQTNQDILFNSFYLFSQNCEGVKGCGRLGTSKAQRVRNNIQVGLKSIKNKLALKTCLAKFEVLFEKFDAQSLIADFFSFTISVPKKLQPTHQQEIY